MFEDGDSVDKIFSISLSDDIEPEIDEVFTVVLSNPPGGSALIDPNAVSHTHTRLPAPPMNIRA